MLDLKEFFDYRDGELIWKKVLSPRAKVGNSAGSVMSHGYFEIGFNGKRHTRHRLVWEYHNGEIPEGYTIDHINNIRGDDRIENLRLLTKKDNEQASVTVTRSHNTSGHRGVGLRKDTGKWRAFIDLNGKHITLGCFDTKEGAISARLAAEEQYITVRNEV